MNNIYNIFKETNLEKISTHFWDKTKPTCWYPSSGYDFRHIFFWDHLKESENLKFPKIFIHTDFTCLDYNPYPVEHMDFMSKWIQEKNEKEGKPTRHPLLSPGYILEVFGSNKSLVIKDCNELFLKEDVFYPNRDLFHFADQIKERTHKVFAIQCQLTNGDRNLEQGDLENKNNEILILLFTMENSNFFYDILLRNDIKVDYLTHINDGGASFGGSNMKMDFIYLYSETLGLKNMIIDSSLEGKEWHSREWVKKKYFNPKVRGESIFEKETEIKPKEWKEQKVYFPTSKGIYIKSKYDTGNRCWDYSFFENEPIKELSHKPNQYSKYVEYNYYTKN